MCVCKGVIFMSALQDLWYDLWYGNLRPSENREISEEEKNLIESMASQQEKSFASLKGNDLAMFSEYISNSEKYASLVEQQAFEIGFKLAVKLLTE